MHSNATVQAEKSSKQPPLILTVSKNAFNRYTDFKTEAEKLVDVTEEKLEKITQLKKLSHEVTKDWENAIGTIQKRRRETILSRRVKADDAKVKLMKELTAQGALERAEIVKEARKLILYRKPQCRLINRALLTSECYRELNAQLDFKKKIESLVQNEDKQYIEELRRKTEIYLNQERKKREERSKKKQLYGIELKKQIENSNSYLQRVELQEKKADKIDLDNMIEELKLIEKCEADQMRKRKEVAKMNFLEAMAEKKKVESKMKHDEEVENRYIAACVKTRDHLNRITKKKWKQSQADKLRRTELIAERCALIWKSNEEETNKGLKQQREHFKEIELEKLNAKRMNQDKMRADIQKYQMEFAAMKKKRQQEQKNINVWETLQRYRRDEYNKEIQSKELQRVWKNKMEVANDLRKQMAEQEAARKRELIMDDDSAYIKAAFDRANEKVMAYGREVLEESKGIRPLFPIIKAIEVPCFQFWLHMVMFVVAILRKMTAKKTWHDCVGSLEDGQVNHLLVYLKQLHYLVTAILNYREPNARGLEIDGHVPFWKIRDRRLEKRHRRSFNEYLHQQLGEDEGNEIVGFDFLGIRWMQEGRWGENHPMDDCWHPIWQEPMSIYSFYKT